MAKGEYRTEAEPGRVNSDNLDWIKKTPLPIPENAEGEFAPEVTHQDYEYIDGGGAGKESGPQEVTVVGGPVPVRPDKPLDVRVVEDTTKKEKGDK